MSNLTCYHIRPILDFWLLDISSSYFSETCIAHVTWEFTSLFLPVSAPLFNIIRYQSFWRQKCWHIDFCVPIQLLQYSGQSSPWSPGSFCRSWLWVSSRDGARVRTRDWILARAKQTWQRPACKDHLEKHPQRSVKQIFVCIAFSNQFMPSI